MKNKPKTCQYCGEELVLEEDYSFEIIDENKSQFDLANARKRFFYLCKNCQFTVGEVKQDKVEWVSKEEAFRRKKEIYETVYKKYELEEKLKGIIPKWFNDLREKEKNQ